MDFRFDPIVDKDLILSHFSEEQIMEYYLGISITKKKLFRSPLRVDKRPTCNVFRNDKGVLIFKDFATGQHLNCFGVVMEKFKCDYHKALDIIANDFGLVDNKNIKKNAGRINPNPIKITDKEPSKIQIEIQNFSEEELNWWKQYGITIDILKRYNVFSCKYLFLNNIIVAKSTKSCPIFGYYGGKVKENNETRELWRCYFPKRKDNRFLTNWPAKKIQGFDQLPKKGKVCIVTKSMKDVMALSAFKIPACAPNSEHLFISDNVLEDLKRRFKYIIILYDQDRTGKLNMAKIRSEHPELIYLVIPKEYGAKDFSDFRKKYGFMKTKEAILNVIKWLKLIRKTKELK